MRFISFVITDNNHPSTTFTTGKDFKNKLFNLFTYISENDSSNWSNFKDILNNSLGNEDNSVSSMSGLCKKYGILSDKYELTSFGKIYLNILRMYNLNKKNKNDEIEKQIEKMEKIFLLNGFFNFLKNGKNNNINYYDVII